MNPPRYPLEGVVSWNMNTVCNYRCSYCTQRFVDDRTQWAKDGPRFVQFFASLPGDWEVKLSGGEPFRHPRFAELVGGLSEGGLRVSVVTNFSSPIGQLAAFAEATTERPGLLSASLHLEYDAPDAFLEKLHEFQQVYRGRVVVTCVATRANLGQLAELKSRFEEEGVAFKAQPQKEDRDVIAYAPSEREQLASLGGHNGTGFIDPNLEGRPCWAGARYFIVDHRGEAYRCYPARRYRRERLGNVLDGSFQLGMEPTACSYAYCNCTVPQQRGMVRLPEVSDAVRR